MPAEFFAGLFLKKLIEPKGAFIVGHDKKKRMDIPEDKVGNGITNNILKIVGVMSGKGGVGKSSVTALTAIELKRQGYRVGVLDADLTGPSIPSIFGVTAIPEKIEIGILPVKTKSNIIMMSMNLLLENPEDPVLWRGPVLSTVIKQFWDDVIWADLDYLLIDLPPGTGDIPLTVLQVIPVDEVLVVTGPQDATNLIVRKSIKMLEKLQIPIAGVVENMAYMQCEGCSERIEPFGESYAEAMAFESGLNVLASLAIDPKLISLINQGQTEEYQGMNMELIKEVAEAIK